MLYSAVFRAKARAVLQRHWQTALLIALIVNLPSLLVQGIGSFTHTDLSLRLQSLMLDASSSQAALDALPEAIRALLSETGVLVMLLAGLFRILKLKQSVRLVLYAAVLLAYCALCGWNPPVVRASLLLLLVLGGSTGRGSGSIFCARR